MALARSQRWLVLVLAADEAQRQSFRDQAQAAKLAGFMTIGLQQERLPLADRMANAVLLSGDVTVNETELSRVLVPASGRVYRQQGAAWQAESLVVPMPENLGSWTHFLQDPSGTKVNQDDAFEFPTGLRFIAGPRLQDNSGANGWRVDQGIATSEWNNTLERGMFYAEARDAFNGTLLWQQVNKGREIKKMRSFVMADGRILRLTGVPIEGKRSPGLGIAAVDPKTGETLQTYASVCWHRRNEVNSSYKSFSIMMATLSKRLV